MQYVVFHGVVHTLRTEAFQEFYIRHVNGFPISSEAELERFVQYLEAAIERQASEGMELELCTEDRVGLISDITTAQEYSREQFMYQKSRNINRRWKGKRYFLCHRCYW
ncbi:ACT domain-containing protein ACR6 [Spatholobus suberectus]|nr:ACT domain-containing protein ACR6 [Spatholobus suberectus]